VAQDNTTFWERVINGVKDSGDDFFNAASEKLAGRDPDTDTFGGKLFAFLRLETAERRAEISQRASNRFRQTRFGQDFIAETKKQELLALIQNPITLIVITILSVFVIGAIARR